MLKVGGVCSLKRGREGGGAFFEACRLQLAPSVGCFLEQLRAGRLEAATRVLPPPPSRMEPPCKEDNGMPNPMTTMCELKNCVSLTDVWAQGDAQPGTGTPA